MSIFYGISHIFTSRSNNDIVTLKAGPGESLQLDGVLSSSSLETNRALSGYYITSRVSTPLSINIWTKMNGTSTVDAHNYKFTHSNNKLIYTGPITGIFYITYSVSCAGTNNDIISFGVSKNAQTPDISSVINVTLPSGSDSTALSAGCHVMLSTSDYFELFAYNASGSNAINSLYTISVLGIF